MDLRYALLLIGIVVVAVVALTTYDRARLRRPRPRPDVDLSDFPRDETLVRPSVLHAARAEGSEKILRSDIEIAPRGQPRHEALRREIDRIEKVATMPLDLAMGLRPGRRAAEPDRQHQPDEKIDFTIHLPGEGPVTRDTALGVFKQHEYKLNKARRLYGQRYRSTRWSDLQLDPQDTPYSDLVLAIQLVDPRGPIDESELNAFTQIGLQLADALHRPSKLPLTFEQGLARARELQAFCDAYDVVADIHVAPSAESAFPGRAIEMAARRVGLQLGAMNLFHMKNDIAPGGRNLFSMANVAEPGSFDPAAWDTFEAPGLTLFMSVPCAYHPVDVFDKMAAAAKEIAEILGGRLQDQNHRPLSDKGIAVIHHQIEEIEEKMTAYGIAPGSEAALKLFSEAATL